MLYCFAFSISWSNTSRRSSADWGMPLPHSRATHCQVVPSIAGKITSHLLPSMETELIMPGFLQKGMQATQTDASGLSMQIGVSVTS